MPPLAEICQDCEPFGGLQQESFKGDKSNVCQWICLKAGRVVWRPLDVNLSPFSNMEPIWGYLNDKDVSLHLSDGVKIPPGRRCRLFCGCWMLATACQYYLIQVSKYNDLTTIGGAIEWSESFLDGMDFSLLGYCLFTVSIV
jgi:hypothetical protein